MGRKALGKSFSEIAQNQQGSFPFEKKTGDQRIIEALQRGETITPLDAWMKQGIYRLSSVVHRLRNGKGHSVDGVHDIKSTTVGVSNQFGEEIKVACYSLVVL